MNTQKSENQTWWLMPLIVYALLLFLPTQPLLVYAAFAPLGLILAVIAHECGHVIGARLARLDVLRFSIGPVSWVKTKEGRFKRISRETNVIMSGEVVPFTTDFTDLRRRHGIMVAGGLIASLIVGLIAILVGIGLQSLLNLVGISGLVLIGYIPGSLTVFGILSLFLFCLNTLPFSTLDAVTDGRQLLKLGGDGQKGQRNNALLQIFYLNLTAIRPSNIPSELIQAALATQDGGPQEAEANLWALLAALDTDSPDMDVYVQRLKRLYRVSYLPVRPSISYWMAFYEALYREDKKMARAWIDEGSRYGKRRFTFEGRLATCAVLLLEGRTREALDAASDCVDLLKLNQKSRVEALAFLKAQLEKLTRKYISEIRPMLEEIDDDD